MFDKNFISKIMLFGITIKIKSTLSKTGVEKIFLFGCGFLIVLLNYRKKYCEFFCKVLIKSNFLPEINFNCEKLCKFYSPKKSSHIVVRQIGPFIVPV